MARLLGDSGPLRRIDVLLRQPSGSVLPAFIRTNAKSLIPTWLWANDGFRDTARAVKHASNILIAAITAAKLQDPSHNH